MCEKEDKEEKEEKEEKENKEHNLLTDYSAKFRNYFRLSNLQRLQVEYAKSTNSTDDVVGIASTTGIAKATLSGLALVGVHRIVAGLKEFEEFASTQCSHRAGTWQW